MALGGVLYVVATPIGNLDDITLRALKTLKTVQLVAAEDTRRTGNLLRHFDIDVPIISVHEHNEQARVQKIIGRLEKGESVALVTDAGTPAVSDPGAGLVAAIRSAGFRIEPIPGASAVAAAISVAGIRSDGFSFLEFPPIRSKDRNKWFAALGEAIIERAVVFFEAPHKLRKTLEQLSLSVNRPIFLAREITKLHEELVWATPAELLSKFETPYGEFTLVIPPAATPENAGKTATDAEIEDLVGQITELNGTRSKREAARIAGERLGLTAKSVYEALERIKLVNRPK